MLSPVLVTSAALLLLLCLSKAVPEGCERGIGRGCFGDLSLTSIPGASTILLRTFSMVSRVATSTGSGPRNNSTELCNRDHNNVTHLGTYDSAIILDSVTDLPNIGHHLYNIEGGVSAGSRSPQEEVYKNFRMLGLFDTASHPLGAGRIKLFLADIKACMDVITNQTVKFLPVKSNEQDTAAFSTKFDSLRISPYCQTPALECRPISAWLKSQSLITAKNRLITIILSLIYWNEGLCEDTAEDLNGTTATGRTHTSTTELKDGSSEASLVIGSVPRLALVAMAFVAAGNFFFM